MSTEKLKAEVLLGIDREKSTTNTEDPHPSHYSRPCQMLPNGIKECGHPAFFGWPSESGALVPICDFCIDWTGTKRRFLKRLEA